jgi:putative transposase
MLYADSKGRIFEHPRFRMAGFSGNAPAPLEEDDLIPMPEFSKLFFIPDCPPVGMDPETGEYRTVPGVKINGVTHYLWRAVDHEGEVLESIVTKTRDRKAALKLLKKSMKLHVRPESIVTDRLRSYGAALKDLGRGDDREIGRWLNNPAENSHLPFRRRERAMLRFRRTRTLRNFASVHASVHNHFPTERHLQNRVHCKKSRAAALAEWRSLLAA